MDTNPERFYQALVSRDPRFDGHFYAGVVTTGIYCRPVCPAPDPKPINVRYFSCAAAAESAGFRPCRRCRPETAPGSPAWLGTSATVSRALRLISEGALDTGDIDALAERLGVGARHLRRLFDHHLGASPIAVAQSRRIHFARNLIDQTNLPMKEIAFASGFASVKRFNTVIRSTFQMTPSELRATTRDQEMLPENGGICLRLPYRAPYDWSAMFTYLRARATPGVEKVTENAYRRSILVNGQPTILEARPDPKRPFLILRLSSPVRRELMDVVERVRRLFDLRADPLMIASHLERDPLLARSVKARPGIRVPGAWNAFELAVRAILGQQVSVKGATTLAGRLVEAHGEAIPGADREGPTRLFPKPEVLARAHISKIGMPESRAKAIRTLARRVADGSLSLSWGDSAREIHEQLVAIPGIGDWTAQYVAMRGLGEPDTFLPGDLGVRKALAVETGRAPSPKAAEARAGKWRPWRAYAVLYLWMAPPERNGKE
jgi:AraC family transcriptional regulator of adaptative response / DNA-3-methyladenine glycosylase II